MSVLRVPRLRVKSPARYSRRTSGLYIRAVGPSLAPLGVSGAHADPKLEVFSGSARTSENDNWGGTAALRDVFAQTGAFDFINADSRDAAYLDAAISSGDHSLRVSDIGGASGLILAKLYEAPVGRHRHGGKPAADQRLGVKRHRP